MNELGDILDACLDDDRTTDWAAKNRQDLLWEAVDTATLQR